MSLVRTLGPGFILLAALPALAGDAPLFPLAEEPDLSALVEESLLRNPEVASAAAAAQAARDRVPQVSALPDPTVSVGYENGGHGWAPGADGDTGVRVTVGQALPGPGKRRLAKDVETGAASAADQALRRERLSVTYRVRRAYADLLLAREQLAILADQEQSTRGIEELTRSRYAVGLGGMPDVLRAQAELARLDQARAAARSGEVSAVADLNALRDRPPGTEVATGPWLRRVADHPPVVPDRGEWLGRIAEASPEVAAEQARAESSRAALDLARHALRPDFMVAASYLNRGSLPPMSGVEVGLVLPVYRGHKQEKGVAEAEARLESARRMQEATGLRVRAAAEKAVADLESQIGQAQALGRVLTVDALAVEAALASYRTGQVPFIAVLDAHNALYRDREAQAEALARALRSSARLDAWIVE
jgi:cobalt-zinc-cadmium efflux system outer membrane protein